MIPLKPFRVNSLREEAKRRNKTNSAGFDPEEAGCAEERRQWLGLIACSA
jgi:hypothetical protein